jgi:hypothetical protein
MQPMGHQMDSPALNNQIRNTVIRDELNIFYLNYRIQSNWEYHVERMESECISKPLTH